MQSATISPDQAGKTLAALLRLHQADLSWSQVRRFIESRHIKLNGELCLDPARRLKEGDVVEIAERPATKPRQQETVVIRHLDTHVVVVEKPAGISTVRHPTERDWPKQRKELSPTLEDIVPRLLAQQRKQNARLRVVQRLDKETSGLLVFARTVDAERGLGAQFKKHTVVRKYLAIIPGYLTPQTIKSQLVRDRGDGRRGSTPFREQGKEAITHIEVLERLTRYTLLALRLETGRTHQIRIHLAEQGHPVCGEKVYQTKVDVSGAPRLALHAAELGFVHPVTGETLHWEMPLPADLRQFLDSLRKPATSSK